ncbi:hypothetical protein ACHQM5_015139 [Ranunculus cassubicifolius]
MTNTSTSEASPTHQTGDSSHTATTTISANPITSKSVKIHNISSLVPVKLTSENYILWQALWLPILRGYDLLKYVDNSQHPPPETIQIQVNGLSVNTPNPEFQTWVQNDQLLLIWLNATISEPLLSYVVGFPTAQSLWNTIENRFATISRSHVLQLRTRLQMLRKGSLSISQYLQNIKSITDNLSAAGSPIEDGDLVFHILNGLPSDYNAFVTSVRIREPPITADSLHSLLLSEELTILDRNRGILQYEPDPKAFPAMKSYPNQSTTNGGCKQRQRKGSFQQHHHQRRSYSADLQHCPATEQVLSSDEPS